LELSMLHLKKVKPFPKQYPARDYYSFG